MNTSIVSNGYTYHVIDGFVQCPYDAKSASGISNFYTLAEKYHRSVINVATSTHSGKLMFVAS